MSTCDGACSILLLHSAAHSLGVASFVYGLAAPRTLLVRDGAGLGLAPSITRSRSTLNLLGRF